MTVWDQIKDNAKFLLVAVAIIAAVCVTARVAEVLVSKRTGREFKWTARKIAMTGILSAIGGALMFLEIPLLFLAPEFYKLDFSEVPAMMAGFLLGPVAGVSVEIVKTLIHIAFKGTHTAFVGEFAAFVTGCLYVIPASFFYLIRKTRKGAVGALITGALCFVVLGSVFNALYLIPRFAELFGMDVDTIVKMGQKIHGGINSLWGFVALCTAPFNLFKAVAVSVIVFLIYKPLSNLYRSIGQG